MTSNLRKIVVSDTTAITYLAKINALFLLKKLFTYIYIPEAVYEELTRQGDHISGSWEVKNLPWIKVKKVSGYEEYAKKFKMKLHIGEAQAIGLALHMNADLLIIDELDGRAEARYQGIPIAGMIGIFKLAKDRNFIVAVKPYLDKLKLTNFKMSPKLYQWALEDAGEFSASKKA